MTWHGVKLEEEALDKIHRLLRTHKRGLRTSEIADKTGLAIGFVRALLYKSECVLKRRKHHPQLWWSDWTDLPPGFRPRFPSGRPRRD